MASSGYKDVTVTQWDTLRFSWETTSQSIANYTSTIAWKLELIATAYGRIDAGGTCEWNVTVDGQKFTGSVNIGIANNATKTLASGTKTISHNTDGTKTFSYSFSQYFGITFSGVWITTKSGSGSGTLDTISSASQPSCITWPEHTPDVGEFGDTISIHMNRQSSALTHTVRYAFGSASGTIATSVGTGVQWTIPLSLMNQIPDSVVGSGTIYVDTYAGGTKIGTKSCIFRATVPASVKPTCSFTLEDITGIDDVYGTPVQGLSKIKITVSATKAYGSDIAAYRITANGVTHNTSPATTSELQKSGSSVVTATVTDKRGRTGTVSYTMNVQAYTAPSVTQLTVRRCNQDGALNDKGLYVRVDFSATVTSLGGKNTASYKLRYKKSTAETFTTVNLTELANQFTVTDKRYIFPADDGSSYNTEIEITDKYRTTVATTSASTGFTLMHYGADGKSLGIGKLSEKSGFLEVALDAEFSGTTIQKGNRYCFSTPGVSGTAGYIKMASITITAANADTPLTFVFCQRSKAATMTVYVRFKSVSALTPDLNTITYEGENYGAFLVQASDSIWDLYIQKGSAYDTIALLDWYTSHTMETRVAVEFPGTLVAEVPTPFYRATPAKLRSLLDFIYPVGSIYLAYNHTDPGDLFGGTWARLENTFLWAVGADGTIGQTGGAKEVTLTVNQIPSHSHGSVYSQHATGTKDKAWYTTTGSSLAYGAVSTGGGQAHNNMPPYIQVSAWRRTA